MQQAGLRPLQLAAVAATPFGIEQQIVIAQELGDVRLERDEIRRVFGVPPDRNGAGDVLVDQAERAAEQVDASRDDRRPHVVVIEDERLDKVIDMALVIRRVDDSSGPRCGFDDLEVLDAPLDLPQDRVQRMLERPVKPVPLRRLQLFEVCEDPLAAVRSSVRAAEVPCHVLAREHGLSDVVRHHEVPEL